MNWYIGQDIVAVRDHGQGAFKRGDEFKIKGLTSSFCKCDAVQIDIGINPLANHSDYSRCKICDTRTYSPKIWWFSERNFAPLDPIKEAISELMESSVSQVTEI